ncbi:hypothetical protein PHYPSEUDO_003596 [Phytophthora pseudosyringae]|uniref:Uncharacterized protein n=1 Tax=Phytophthora pseudosyringae TaxID=221518 RepID=A0A8T1VU02_9STRA|nr:hypothetical protein PHYPSEUDO_003596 [Phytophthora pseudosyringae]
MSWQPPASNPFEITVDDLLVMPEIQEALTTYASENMPLTLASLPRHTGSSGVLGDSEGVTPGDEKQKKQQAVLDEDVRLDFTLQISRSMYGFRSYECAFVPCHSAPSNRKHVSIPAEEELEYQFVHATSTRSERHVHAIGAAEFVELRGKVAVQTASLRRSNLQKTEVRQQKQQIQELQATLCRLQQVEAQLLQYTQRSDQSLRLELQMLEQEVATLSERVREAVQQELNCSCLLFGTLAPVSSENERHRTEN